MEKQKLELRHLAPYLPYGLQVKLEFASDTELPWYYEDKEVFTLEGMMLDWYNSSNITKITPLLIPPFMLKKELTIGGETFIPIRKLFEIPNEGTRLIDENDGIIKIRGGQYIDVMWDRLVDDFGEIETHQFIYSPDHRCFNHRIYDFEKEEYYPMDITNQVDLINKLFEWHFDVFDLINSGLALNKTQS